MLTPLACLGSAVKTIDHPSANVSRKHWHRLGAVISSTGQAKNEWQNEEFESITHAFIQ
jgi:hypothetical protein